MRERQFLDGKGTWGKIDARLGRREFVLQVLFNQVIVSTWNRA